MKQTWFEKWRQRLSAAWDVIVGRAYACYDPPGSPLERVYAEWVGYYFGLQYAINLKRLPEEYRKQIMIKMTDTAAKLPPGTIDRWPDA
jgi:hypothetical protein